MSDWAREKASKLSLDLNAEFFHKHANMIAAALREAEARGRASMKEDAANELRSVYDREYKAAIEAGESMHPFDDLGTHEVLSFYVAAIRSLKGTPNV